MPSLWFSHQKSRQGYPCDEMAFNYLFSGTKLVGGIWILKFKFKYSLLLRMGDVKFDACESQQLDISYCEVDNLDRFKKTLSDSSIKCEGEHSLGVMKCN